MLLEHFPTPEKYDKIIHEKIRNSSFSLPQLLRWLGIFFALEPLISGSTKP